MEELMNRMSETPQLLFSFVCEDNTQIQLTHKLLDRRGPTGGLTVHCNRGPNEYWWHYRDPRERSIATVKALECLIWHIEYHIPEEQKKEQRRGEAERRLQEDRRRRGEDS